MNYLSGFGNHFSSEAKDGVLPVGQNSPQKVKDGLYAEQITGTAFTRPRSENLRSWFYRLRPSVRHGDYKERVSLPMLQSTFDGSQLRPNQERWNPQPEPQEKTHFVESLTSYAGCGSPADQIGCAIHLYSCNESMTDLFFYNADGEMLVVPELGKLAFETEMGRIELEPHEICVIPRGLRFRVETLDPHCRGYVCENFGETFRLPDLGPIGANGLANPRDFQVPTARYEKKEGRYKIWSKILGNVWEAHIDHSPLNVVAWHGNFVPYKYNLDHFNTINTVSFDHPDPSIFTVLTSPSGLSGVANIDFVIFPPRWIVAQNTFRPPYFHRNMMNEFMGLIEGEYDAKADGFSPGGASLHNCMSGHGPDLETYKKASEGPLEPHYIDNTLAFMFETSRVLIPTEHSMQSELRQKDYYNCWEGL